MQRIPINVRNQKILTAKATFNLQKLKAEEIRRKKEELFLDIETLEPQIQEACKFKGFENLCKDLIKSKYPGDKFRGILSIASSRLIVKYLPTLIELYYTEKKQEDVRSLIVLSVVDFLQFFDENGTNQNLNILFNNYGGIKRLLVDSSNDQSDLVKDHGLFAMGETNDLCFFDLVRSQMWVSKNSVIRETAANSLYELVSSNPSCKLKEPLYLELKRAYYEDPDISLSLIPSLTGIVLETRNSSMGLDLIHLLEETQINYTHNPMHFNNIYDVVYEVRDFFGI